MKRLNARQILARRRGAALYVVVLAVTLIVAVLGLASLSELHLQREAFQRQKDMQLARQYAQAAVEIGMQRIADDADWRNSYLSGDWESNQLIGEGTYTLAGVDPNDDLLGGDPTDPVELTGIGKQGLATQKVMVTLVPQPRPLTCLEVALHVGGSLQVHQPATISGNATLSSNDTVSAVGAVTIHPDCEAVNGFSGTVSPGTNTSGIDSRETPDTADAFTYYQTNGTAISIGSIPTVDSMSTIEQVVISAANNPYGAGVTNAQGIYVIDCLGQNIRIRNCRIVGTLLLLNAGSGSQIADSVNWSTTVANFPALLVDGSLAFDFANAPLSETTTSFNPPGTPYEDNADTDLADSFPSVIAGLVYVSVNSTSNNHPVFDGVVVIGNALSVFADVDLSYRATYFGDPPPGFVVYDKMKISSGSWTQRVD